MTPAPDRPVRPEVRLLAMVFALVTMLAPAAAVTPSAPDDSPTPELVLSVRAEVAPSAPSVDAAAPDDDRPIGAAPTDDGLVHPDLEPHDGPPPLRGPPAS